MKQNVRGAGRRRALPAETISIIKKRQDAGETITALAAEYGVSRQTLSCMFTMMSSQNSKRAGRCLFYETECTWCGAQARAIR